MTLRQDDTMLVGEQGRRLESPIGIVAGVGEAVDECEIDFARPQHREAAVGLGLGHVECDRRVAAAEFGDHGRQEGRERAAEGGRAQTARTEAAQRVELRLGGGDLLQDRLGVFDQDAAGVGQLDGPDGAIEERELHLVLERGDLLRDRGLRVAEFVGGARERAMRGDLRQRPQPPYVAQHQHSLSDHTQVKLR
jgi:hypothetical protein